MIMKTTTKMMIVTAAVKIDDWDYFTIATVEGSTQVLD